ncbi:MAG TPA: hypothetical protein VG411_09500, partial [Actinomycetota bacterium]|nr:hypothetical protein [Actinomycetota bacterium]
MAEAENKRDHADGPQRQRRQEGDPEHGGHQVRVLAVLGNQSRPAQRPGADGQDDRRHGQGPGQAERPPAARRQPPVGEQQRQEHHADDDAGHEGPAGQPARQLPTGQRQLPRGEPEGQGGVLLGDVEGAQRQAGHQEQPGQQVAPVADHDQGPDGRQDQRVHDA